MGTIHLIRHGQASFAQAHYDRLSDLGRRQAVVTGAFLAESETRVDAAFSGPLDRQRETGRLALEAAGLSPHDMRVLDEFREYDLRGIFTHILPLISAENDQWRGRVEGMYQDSQAFQAVFLEAWRRWMAGEYDAPDLETWPAFIQRVEAGIQRVLDGAGPGNTLMVFTSGGPVSVAVRLALGLDDPTTLEVNWRIRNASITSFLYGEGRLTLSVFNAAMHLERRPGEGLVTFR